jgi:hypothetical protein
VERSTYSFENIPSFSGFKSTNRYGNFDIPKSVKSKIILNLINIKIILFITLTIYTQYKTWYNRRCICVPISETSHTVVSTSKHRYSNKLDNLCIYTSNHKQESLVFDYLLLFAPATNLDDIKHYLMIKQQI